MTEQELIDFYKEHRATIEQHIEGIAIKREFCYRNLVAHLNHYGQYLRGVNPEVEQLFAEVGQLSRDYHALTGRWLTTDGKAVKGNGSFEVTSVIAEKGND